MAVRLRRAWTGLPQWVRWVLVVYLVGFAEGTGDHVLWMTHGGIHAYAPSYPQIAIQVLFVSLVVLDPLVVVLVVFVRREGIWLAAAVIVLDVAANWIGNWTHIRREWVPNVPWLLTVYGMFIVVTLPPLLRVMKVAHRQVDGQTPVGVIDEIAKHDALAKLNKLLDGDDE